MLTVQKVNSFDSHAKGFQIEVQQCICFVYFQLLLFEEIIIYFSMN